MMLRYMLTAAVVLSGQICFAEDHDTLDKLLDERIEINAKYGEENAEFAADTEYAKILQPLEKEIGQEWVDYLRYVKTTKDVKLKVHALRLEYLDEIRSFYYDLEYAETEEEKKEYRDEILKYKKKLELVMEAGKAMPVEK